MYFHNFFTTCVRGSGLDPTTAARAALGCNGAMKALLAFLFFPDFLAFFLVLRRPVVFLRRAFFLVLRRPLVFTCRLRLLRDKSLPVNDLYPSLVLTERSQLSALQRGLQDRSSQPLARPEPGPKEHNEALGKPEVAEEAERMAPLPTPLIELHSRQIDSMTHLVQRAIESEDGAR